MSMSDSARWRAFLKAMSELAKILQFGNPAELADCVRRIEAEFATELCEVVQRGTDWLTTDASVRAMYLTWLSVLNESMCLVCGSELLGGGFGFAVQELADQAANRVARLIVCGRRKEAGCESVGEFKSLVRRTVISAAGF